MGRSRQQCNPSFKAGVALEAILNKVDDPLLIGIQEVAKFGHQNGDHFETTMGKVVCY